MTIGKLDSLALQSQRKRRNTVFILPSNPCWKCVEGHHKIKGKERDNAGSWNRKSNFRSPVSKRKAPNNRAISISDSETDANSDSEAKNAYRDAETSDEESSDGNDEDDDDDFSVDEDGNTGYLKWFKKVHKGGKGYAWSGAKRRRTDNSTFVELEEGGLTFIG